MKRLMFLLTCALVSSSHAKKTTTALCDEQRLAEMKKAVDQCWNLAYLNFLEEKLVMVEDFEARCNYLNFKIECALKYEAIYDCYTPNEQDNLRTKFLLEQLELATEDTTLGEPYIGHCSTLKLFKFQYLYDNFGFTNCSLSKIFEAFRHKKACEHQLEAKIKYLMGFGATSAAWASIFCTNYLESLECQQFVMDCKDPRKKADLEAENAAAALQKQDEIRKNGFIYFEIENCKHLKRKRRFA